MLEDKLGGETMRIDVGGTPAAVIRDNPFENFTEKEKLIVILDPFDNARFERTIYFAEGLKLKLPSNLNELEKVLENSKPRIVGKLANLLGCSFKKIEEVYTEFSQKLLELSGEGDIRKVMNGILRYLVEQTYPQLDVEYVLLEDVQRRIVDKVRALVEKYDIKARAVCPVCGQFVLINLRDGKTCCCVSAVKILESGAYIAQGGYLPLIVASAGYVPDLSSYAEDSQYLKNAIELLEGNYLPYRYEPKVAKESLALAYFKKKVEK